MLMVNGTGGLKIDDKPIPLTDQDEMIIEGVNDELIKAPNIGLMDNSDSDDNTNHEINNEIDTEINGTDSKDTQITINDIHLGLFSDNNDIYNSEIKDMEFSDSTKIDTLNFQDFVNLAFRYKDEPYTIYELKYV